MGASSGKPAEAGGWDDKDILIFASFAEEVGYRET